jgi:hypothetical protein
MRLLNVAAVLLLAAAALFSLLVSTRIGDVLIAGSGDHEERPSVGFMAVDIFEISLVAIAREAALAVECRRQPLRPGTQRLSCRYGRADLRADHIAGDH